jgi:hypothetical protein
MVLYHFNSYQAYKVSISAYNSINFLPEKLILSIIFCGYSVDNLFFLRFK